MRKLIAAIAIAILVVEAVIALRQIDEPRAPLSGTIVAIYAAINGFLVGVIYGLAAT